MSGSLYPYYVVGALNPNKRESHQQVSPIVLSVSQRCIMYIFIFILFSHYTKKDLFIMTPDRARCEMDNVPCLPMRKRSLDVDDVVVSQPFLANTSCGSITNNRISIFEDSREKIEWDLSSQVMTKGSPLADSPKLFELCSKSSIASSGSSSRVSARGLRQSDYRPSLSCEKSNPSVVNNTSSIARATGIDKGPFMSVRRRPRTNGFHRTLNMSKDHSRRCYLIDRLPTVKEFQRSDFEEDQSEFTRAEQNSKESFHVAMVTFKDGEESRR
jgi:hypothetical protein